ncbi:hypothetical protein BDV97DRAFT_41046 [Delphinella strobiligena]|nr:hypothetical protein BDV97DRAFT_41046 [Delphinella strobiligena]
MASKMMLLDEFLPATALGLGTLVESLMNPIMDAYKPALPLPEDAVLPTAASSFDVLSSSSKSTSFRVALTRLLDTSHSIDGGRGTRLQSAQVKRYQLRQPRAIFKALCQEDEATRTWLEQGIQAGNKSYMVVELQTVVDPSVQREDVYKNTTKGELTVPVSAIASSGMDSLGLGAMLDSGPGMDYTVSKDLKKSFSLDGEHIFAVGYKKIIWKSWGLKRKKIDEAALDSDIKWTILGQKRGRDEEKELVSFDLTDDLLAKGNSKTS